jgi:methionyl-tRNA formyltransferase
MTKQDLRIVFMGTPEFAVASLQALVENNFNVVGVITAPDKPAGRGMQLQQSAVKKYAVENNLTILQPEKLKNPDFLEKLKNVQANLQVVVAFRMLPEIVWNMPTYGTINVHGSLLPNYRGAAPINWAIINGEIETGVTTFKLQHEIDTGNILLQEKFTIAENDTAGTVHDKMKVIGAATLIKTLDKLIEGTLKEFPQNDFSPTLTENTDTSLRKDGMGLHAPKLFTETCKIDWNNSTETIYNLIRGLSPYPAAFSYLQTKILKIFNAKKEIVTHHHPIGEYVTDNKTYLKFATSNGFVHCLEIQLEGKKKMKVEDFLRGNKL